MPMGLEEGTSYSFFQPFSCPLKGLSEFPLLDKKNGKPLLAPNTL